MQEETAVHKTRKVLLFYKTYSEIIMLNSILVMNILLMNLNLSSLTTMCEKHYTNFFFNKCI